MIKQEVNIQFYPSYNGLITEKQLETLIKVGFKKKDFCFIQRSKQYAPLSKETQKIKINIKDILILSEIFEEIVFKNKNTVFIKY